MSAASIPYHFTQPPPTTPAPNPIIRLAALSFHSPRFRRVLRFLPVTCAITFFTTLLVVHATYVSVGLHPPQGIVCQYNTSNTWLSPPICLKNYLANTSRSTNIQYYNITELYTTCRHQLCDISVYGGWFAGPEHTYFRIGMTLLAAQLLVLLYGRLGLLHVIAPDDLKAPCCCTGSVVSYRETCCSPSRCATIFGPLATLCLLPMAFIPFYTSVFHVLSAVVTFITLAIAELSDAIVQLRILRTLRPGSLCCDLNGRGCLTVVFNFTCALGGLLCFCLWGFSTYFEWLAASLPFFYFAPFVWQTDWYDEHTFRCNVDEGQNSTGGVELEGAGEEK
jgi:hypothetical protein